MRYQCPECDHVTAPADGEVPTTCAGCGARVRRSVRRAATGPRVVVRVPPPEAPDLRAERRAALRERREYYREERGHRRDDRLSNPLGVSGFAVVTTTTVLVLSGWLFARTLPAYLYVVATLAVPAAVTGLALSLVGSFLRGRPRVVALSGVTVGVPVILFLLPMSFALRDWLAR